MDQVKRELSGTEILKLMPHRYPMLMLDKLTLLPREGATQIEPGMKVAGIKNVSFNEPYFQGHFPEKPVMPGVLVGYQSESSFLLYTGQGNACFQLRQRRIHPR